MKTDVSIAIDFAGTQLQNPVMLASGTCGYGDELADFLDIHSLGGFVTKSISVKPRKGNPVPRIVETSAGMLNAIGLANVGVERFLEEKIPILQDMAQAGVAIYVNIVGSTLDEYVAVTERLAPETALTGFELNISCPNVKKGGISFGTDPEAIAEITRAVKNVTGDKTLMVKLTPTVTDISVTARAAVDHGADALSLVNTFTAMVIDVETRRPLLANRTGGLSGPAIKPIAVYLVNRVYHEVTQAHGIPILGLGGICHASDAIEFMLAGATAVAVGTASFMEPACAARVMAGLADYCKRKGIDAVQDLVGSVE